MTRTHRIKVKVYYEDTDAGGVVYYANYLKYMERARIEFLLEKGVDLYGYHGRGMYFAVTRLEIRYRRPGRLGDALEVETGLEEVRNASITLSHRITRQGDVLVEARLTIAFVGNNGRPTRLPEIFRTL